MNFFLQILTLNICLKIYDIIIFSKDSTKSLALTDCLSIIPSNSDMNPNFRRYIPGLRNSDRN
jgi:hypothetical protein